MFNKEFCLVVGILKMKKSKGELPAVRRCKLMHFLMVIAALYLLFICCKFPEFFEIATVVTGDDSLLLSDKSLARDVNNVESIKPLLSSVYIDTFHRRLEDNEKQNAPLSTRGEALEEQNSELSPIKPLDHPSTSEISKDKNRNRNRSKNKTRTVNKSVLDRMADEAWTLGLKAWKEVEKYDEKENGPSSTLEGKPESCPSWVVVNGEDFSKGDGVVFLPCGLAAGSSITMVGTPHYAHHEYVRKRGRKKKRDSLVLVSQFVIELQGLKSVVGEDPPKIFHVNPRLRGDWSHEPVIEHNTCYRMQWGTSQRCDGSPSKNDDDMLVDGLPRCEKWMKNDIVDLKESRTTSWFNRFIGRAQKPEVTWPYPFVEGKLFVLTIRAGVDGYHIVVGGHHVTSFSYRTGFTLEDATGLVIKGDVDVHSVFATSLPISHPSFSPERVLEMSMDWKSHPLPTSPIRLFIGILSATNHFAERMAVRKTWMQSSAIRSSDVVARFFVALNPRKEVNRILKEEAAYFGDIVIVPFMDHYELVVLKTIAICEYGVRNATAPYIMKCDDDTFMRVDTVLKELESVSSRGSLYMGNLNRFHRPLRTGKWAVGYEEWPESQYPPYANGPGYIISSDIAKYIVSQHANRSLRLFKMEDVSMGLWVERFNRSTRPVQYAHNWKFCQYGCMENYFTAHYQSPRQMICLWDNLVRGQARCCNF